ncbi:piggyBac transposable element-derived protein 1-like [Schistocerca serialis cubense]|uniref:piggyBac transposable element-derived protein 1-like n=1 Tax=Schistocerca serialis cubense TaxID=2023355 RepID=UPI00214EA3D6|nr:piggyBac transposable element-derived protein 1-like [Schistocerca serialis cubense]
MYMPDNPHKCDYKLFLLFGVSGYAYKMEMCTGHEHEWDKNDAEPDLGASSNVVARLCWNVPENVNDNIYFDNYYTSIPLMHYLKGRGILSLGTVSRNRVHNKKLPDDKSLSKEERGKILEFIGNYEGTEISNVVWQDNKTVMLLSTSVGSDPVSNVKRYDRSGKEHIFVSCLKIVQIYNKHMGEVDLLKSLIGRYRIIIWSKKWHFRIFYHLVDLATVNSWILYCRVNSIRNPVSEAKELQLANFRIELAETLLKIVFSSTPKRGRPSFVEKPQAKKKKTTSRHPTKNVRFYQESQNLILLQVKLMP